MEDNYNIPTSLFIKKEVDCEQKTLTLPFIRELKGKAVLNSEKVNKELVFVMYKNKTKIGGFR